MIMSRTRGLCLDGYWEYNEDLRIIYIFYNQGMMACMFNKGENCIAAGEWNIDSELLIITGNCVCCSVLKFKQGFNTVTVLRYPSLIEKKKL